MAAVTGCCGRCSVAPRTSSVSLLTIRRRGEFERKHGSSGVILLLEEGAIGVCAIFPRGDSVAADGGVCAIEPHHFANAYINNILDMTRAILVLCCPPVSSFSVDIFYCCWKINGGRRGWSAVTLIGIAAVSAIYFPRPSFSWRSIPSRGRIFASQQSLFFGYFEGGVQMSRNHVFVLWRVCHLVHPRREMEFGVFL